jgi:hypothetical protein
MASLRCLSVNNADRTMAAGWNDTQPLAEKQTLRQSLSQTDIFLYFQGKTS